MISHRFIFFGRSLLPKQVRQFSHNPLALLLSNVSDSFLVTSNFLHLTRPLNHSDAGQILKDLTRRGVLLTPSKQERISLTFSVLSNDLRIYPGAARDVIINQPTILNLNPHDAREKLETLQSLINLPPHKLFSILMADSSFLTNTSKPQIEDVINGLKGFRLTDGEIGLCIRRYPVILSNSYETILSKIDLFNRAHYTRKEIRLLLLHSTPFLGKSPLELEQIHNYLKNDYCLKHYEIVDARAFMYTFQEIYLRLEFMSKRGLFRKRDKFGNFPTMKQATLKNILEAKQSSFIAEVACASKKDFELFTKVALKKLASQMDKETEEEEESSGSLVDYFRNKYSL